MLDVSDIRRAYEDDNTVISNPYLPRARAIAKLRQAHQHRGLLLKEVDRLREQIDGLETQLDASEAMLKALAI